MTVSARAAGRWWDGSPVSRVGAAAPWSLRGQMTATWRRNCVSTQRWLSGSDVTMSRTAPPILSAWSLIGTARRPTPDDTAGCPSRPVPVPNSSPPAGAAEVWRKPSSETIPRP